MYCPKKRPLAAFLQRLWAAADRRTTLRRGQAGASQTLCGGTRPAECGTHPDYNEIPREERERVYRSLGIQTIIVGAKAASELENAVSEAARWRA